MLPFSRILTRRTALLSLIASTVAQSPDTTANSTDNSTEPRGLLSSILNPVLETVGSTLNGDGLIDSTLGAIGGILGAEQTFDYIVVGGGTAGAGVGVRLAEAGFSVAIIEAGGFYEVEKPLFSTTPAGSFFGVGASPLDTIPTTDWGFNTEPQPHLDNRRIHYARGKCLGGSSALNFMVYHRGTTASYQRWADAVDDQSYTLGNLTPFFNRAVTFTPPGKRSLTNITTNYDASSFSNNGGPVQVGYGFWVSIWASLLEKAFTSLGLQKNNDFNNGKLLGYHYSQSTLRASDQTRSSSVAYIHAVQSNSEASRNLKVFTHTQARRILFDKSSARPKANGVEVSALVGLAQYTIKARREVIVSAGAFQSPQLLMLSGIGPTDELQEHNIEQLVSAPGVGKNMWDHILFGPTYSVKFATVGSTLLRPVKLAAALVEYAAQATGLLTYAADILGWEKLSKLDGYRDKLSQSTLDALNTFPEDWPEVEYIAADAYAGNFRAPLAQQPLDGKKYVSILGAMVAPLSRGNITLKSANPLAAPAIDPNWLSDPADKELAIAWYRRMREIFTTKDVASQLEEVGVEAYPGLDKNSDEAIMAAIRDSAITVWHASSTCRMGKSVLKDGVRERVDEMDVVDSEAKVFGVDGLRVVDASIFPFLPPGHPQSTIYALAEKISDIIIQNGRGATS